MESKKLKILLIEDRLGERLSILKALAPYHTQIDTAITFSRARDLAHLKQYDLVISELVLSHCPEMQGDGVQFWSFFRHLHPNVPFVIMAEENMRLVTEFITKGSITPPIFSKTISDQAIRDMMERISLVEEVALAIAV